MRCSEIQDMLSVYLDDELKPAQTARLEAHFRVCPRCAEELDLTRATIALSQSLDEVEVPSGFRAALHSRLLEENRRRHPLRSAAGGAWRFGSWVRKMPVAAAAALALAVALGAVLTTSALRRPAGPSVAFVDAQSGPAPVEPAPVRPELDQKQPTSNPGRTDQSIPGGTDQATSRGPDQSTPAIPGKPSNPGDNKVTDSKGKETHDVTVAMGPGFAESGSVPADSATGTTPLDPGTGTAKAASALGNGTQYSSMGVPAPGASTEAATDPNPKTGPKLVKQGSVWIQVNDLEKAKDRVLQVAQASSGYARSNTMIQASPDRKIRALMLRVPARSFDQTIQELTQVGRVQNPSAWTGDNTDEYADLLKKIAAARKQEKVLQVNQSRASTDEESQKVDAQLEQVRNDIRAMETRRLELDLSSVMPSIRVILEEVPASGGYR